MEDGTVDGSAFRLRPNEERLSVNWMEYFDQVSEDAQVHLIAQLIRMDTGPNGRFAKLSVGDTKGRVSAPIRFLLCPLPAECGHEADPSHSEIDGLPPNESPASEWAGDLLAARVETLFEVS